MRSVNAKVSKSYIIVSTLPIADNKEREAYYLEFPERNTLKYVSVNPANGFVAVDKEYDLVLEYFNNNYALF